MGHAQYLTHRSGECRGQDGQAEAVGSAVLVPPGRAGPGAGVAARLRQCQISLLSSPADASALVAALTQFTHLAADTIVNGGATSHLAPTDPADRKWARACVTQVLTTAQGRDRPWRQNPGSSGAGASHGPPPAGLVDACRECGARALELVGQLQDPQAVQQAQPGLVRTPLQGILRLGQVSMQPSAECGLRSVRRPRGWGAARVPDLSPPSSSPGPTGAHAQGPRRWGPGPDRAPTPESRCPSLSQAPCGTAGGQRHPSDPRAPSCPRS